MHLGKRSIRVTLAIVVVATVGLGAAAWGIAGKETTPQGAPPPNAAEVAKLEALIVRAAQENGEDYPWGGLVLPTTRRAWFEADGTELGPHQDAGVYVVRARGNFTLYGAGRATRETPPPRGTVLTLVVGANSLDGTPRVYDLALDNVPANLGSLGEVKAIALSTAGAS
jgi:hypothetical protein